MTEVIDEEVRADIEALCAAFHSALCTLGIDAAEVKPAGAGACRLSTSIDPYEGKTQTLGEWLAPDGSRYAHFVRYANGNIFAEHDVLRAHPSNPGEFVEAIEVWGYAEGLKSEVRTLPAL